MGGGGGSRGGCSGVGAARRRRRPWRFSATLGSSAAGRAEAEPAVEEGDAPGRGGWGLAPGGGDERGIGRWKGMRRVGGGAGGLERRGASEVVIIVIHRRRLYGHGPSHPYDDGREGGGRK